MICSKQVEIKRVAMVSPIVNFKNPVTPGKFGRLICENKELCAKIYSLKRGKTQTITAIDKNSKKFFVQKIIQKNNGEIDFVTTLFSKNGCVKNLIKSVKLNIIS